MNSIDDKLLNELNTKIWTIMTIFILIFMIFIFDLFQNYFVDWFVIIFIADSMTALEPAHFKFIVEQMRAFTFCLRFTHQEYSECWVCWLSVQLLNDFLKK